MMVIKILLLDSMDSLQNPAGLSAKSLSKKLGKWNDSIASVKTEIEIKPNETEECKLFYWY